MSGRGTYIQHLHGGVLAQGLGLLACECEGQVQQLPHPEPLFVLPEASGDRTEGEVRVYGPPGDLASEMVGHAG